MFPSGKNILVRGCSANDANYESYVQNMCARRHGTKIIFVIGGPGSGKGTQCEKIARRYNFTHLSSGDLLREEVQSGSPSGRQLKQIMEAGQLVPNHMVLQLLKEAILKHRYNTDGFVIDGYPREINQGITFENDVSPCNYALVFDVNEQTMMERLLKRGQSSGRVDDNKATIAKRFATYNTQTMPVINYYRQENKLIRIDGSQSPENVFQKVVQVLDKKLL